ncbi:Bug family tripartite tricarboxylate transporter substrate binding protein [Pseudomonas typographi]|uniref:Tripartite tricarboxylate transporter substrate binding protein n=1 Tax=Pseudomonas typographi TaxID=2715964 RepID=A0ABR7Z8A8_9PSED|nr:tripartite tricarboxylate transporter substrate binding protein [Pseudomonas typographi]MBD1552050.1 tripartite tricarboxylate transporter substrate binding protein [Pseudomonas typographi]MBD1601766.1 tripartite tricarboxylate transporter substrate binding protein [Pseudomonas typographi]
MRNVKRPLKALALALATVLSASALAAYPDHPVKLVAPYPPGGQTDIVARIVATELSTEIGQPVVVENRPGSNGLLGHAQVAAAKADGYTLLLGNSAMLAVTVKMMDNMPYDPLTSFAPIAVVGGGPYVLEVKDSLPAKTLPQFLDLAKHNPGTLNFGLGGYGSLPHLLSEQLQFETGARWLTVGYKGAGPMLVDLLSGQLDFSIDNLSSSLEYIKSGRVRALAVSDKTDQLPGVPTFAEAGLPNVNARSWHGVLAPAGTAPAIVAQLNAAIAKSLAKPAVIEKLRAAGVDVLGGSPEDFAKLIASENQRWGAVVAQTGAKLD